MTKIIVAGAFCAASLFSTFVFASDQVNWSQYKNKYVALSGSQTTYGLASLENKNLAIEGTNPAGLFKDEYFEIEAYRLSAGYTMIDPLNRPGVSLRPELEFASREIAASSLGFSSNISANNLEIESLALNAYVDFNYGKKWRPYVGAGIGKAQVSGKATLSTDNTTVYNLKDDETTFMQAITGVNIDLENNAVFFAQYRIESFNEIKNSGTTLDLDSAHSAELGLRIHF